MRPLLLLGPRCCRRTRQGCLERKCVRARIQLRDRHGTECRATLQFDRGLPVHEGAGRRRATALTHKRNGDTRGRSGQGAPCCTRPFAGSIGCGSLFHCVGGVDDAHASKGREPDATGFSGLRLWRIPNESSAYLHAVATIGTGVLHAEIDVAERRIVHALESAAEGGSASVRGKHTGGE